MDALSKHMQTLRSASRARGMEMLNSQIPQEKRSQFVNSIRAWSSGHPKLSAFLLSQLVATGTPILIFTIFTATVLLSSLVTCVLIGSFIALAFTAFCASIAMLVLLPTIFFTTIAVTILFSSSVLVAQFLEYLHTRRAQIPPREANGKPVLSTMTKAEQATKENTKISVVPSKSEKKTTETFRFAVGADGRSAFANNSTVLPTVKLETSDEINDELPPFLDPLKLMNKPVGNSKPLNFDFNNIPNSTQKGFANGVTV